MAGLVIAFLAGVSLMVIFHSRLNKLGPIKQQLRLCEPLELVLQNWRAVRWVGPEAELKKLAGSFTAAMVEPSSLDLILRAEEAINHSVLIDGVPLGPLGQRRTIGEGTSEVIAIGLWPEIEPLLDATTPAKKRQEMARLSDQGASEGYLVLIIAGVHVHGQANTNSPLRLNGALLLEPAVDHQRLASFQERGGQLRFVSVLPSVLVAQVLQLPSSPASHDWLELQSLSPADQERSINESLVIGLADSATKHGIIRSLERHFSCEFVSTLSGDDGLPSQVKKIV